MIKTTFHTFVVLVAVQGIPRFPGIPQHRTQNADNWNKKYGNNLLVNVKHRGVPHELDRLVDSPSRH